MLLLLRRLQSNRLSGRAISSICRRSSSNSAQAQQHEPLKILFCGADDFSIFSLQALCDLQYTRPGIVDSIDVVCRPDKRVGRGLKKLKQGSSSMNLSSRGNHHVDSLISSRQKSSNRAGPSDSPNRHIHRMVASFRYQSRCRGLFWPTCPSTHSERR